MDGIEATSRIVALALDPAPRVVVLTTFDRDRLVYDAMRAGAVGFLTKDVGAAEIRSAIITVAHGRAQLDPMVQRKLLSMLTAGSSLRTTPAASPYRRRVPV